MHCASCSSRVERALSEVAGVENVSVNLATGRATIEAGNNRLSAQDVQNAVEQAGYGLEIEEAKFQVEDMHCASCVARIEGALKSETGVLDIGVNLIAKEVRISFIRGMADPDSLRKTISQLGFSVASIGSDAIARSPVEIQENEYRQSIKRFIIAAIGAVIVMTFSMTEMLPQKISYPLMLIITALVLIFPGRGFFSGAARLIVRKSADMNTLIAVGSGTAFIYSAIITVLEFIAPEGRSQSPVYFDTATGIVTLILLGRALEAKAKRRAVAAISGLMDLAPRQAMVLRRNDANGETTWVELPAAELKVGDSIRVRAGEQVPTDGFITEGASAINQATLTGESIPVEKKPGDEVLGGTLNQSGSFIMRASRVGSETVLAGIIRLVDQAQGSKAPIQRLADKVASIFVPVVIVIALLTLTIWLIFGSNYGLSYTLTAFVSVLIIACPCAMGLATPTAVMVASGTAASRGVVFKGGEVLEKTARLNMLILDKTGTITEGKPHIEEINIIGDIDPDRFLAIAAAVESGSEHPLAQAVVAAAREKDIAIPLIENFKFCEGRGVMGMVDGERIVAGSLAWLSEVGVELDRTATAQHRQLEEKGLSIIGVAVGDRLSGWIGFSDRERLNAKAAIQRIKQLGLKTLMLTGDRRAPAERMAEKVGVDEFRAEVLPAEKAEVVREYMKKGYRVGMVGDGVNDAPALATADVGIAVGSGSDVAIEVADVSLVGSDPLSIADAIRIARRTLRIIKQNLFWAFFYNSLGIPLAAGVLFPITGKLITPMFAAAAMAFSSLSVVLNSLRLRKSFRNY